MAKYAATTSVTSEKSRAEIERTLSKYGATSFAYGWEETRSVIGFRIENRQVRFVLPLPDRHSREFTHTPERAGSVGRIRTLRRPTNRRFGSRGGRCCSSSKPSSRPSSPES